MADKGKIICMGSNMARNIFNGLSSALQQRWSKENITKEEIISLLKEYEQAVQDGTFREKGWTGNYKFTYGVSKLAVNLFPSILARYEEVRKKHLQVYSCSPGYVKSEMTNFKGVYTIE